MIINKFRKLHFTFSENFRNNHLINRENLYHDGLFSALYRMRHQLNITKSTFISYEDLKDALHKRELGLTQLSFTANMQTLNIRLPYVEAITLDIRKVKEEQLYDRLRGIHIQARKKDDIKIDKITYNCYEIDHFQNVTGTTFSGDIPLRYFEILGWELTFQE